MPLKETTLQNQLERAQAALSRVESVLGDQVPKKNPDWRKANSRVNQIQGRLSSRSTLLKGNSDESDDTTE